MRAEGGRAGEDGLGGRRGGGGGREGGGGVGVKEGTGWRGKGYDWDWWWEIGSWGVREWRIGRGEEIGGPGRRVRGLKGRGKERN